MKRFLTFGLILLLMVSGLSGCGYGDGGKVSLVFVNDSDATIAAVVASFENHSEGIRNIDNSPLNRGYSFDFEAGEYPVTVVVYEDVSRQKELTHVTIGSAPPEGKRWYVTARDSEGGLQLVGEAYWLGGRVSVPGLLWFWNLF